MPWTPESGRTSARTRRIERGGNGCDRDRRATRFGRLRRRPACECVTGRGSGRWKAGRRRPRLLSSRCRRKTKVRSVRSATCSDVTSKGPATAVVVRPDSGPVNTSRNVGSALRSRSKLNDRGCRLHDARLVLGKRPGPAAQQLAGFDLGQAETSTNGPNLFRSDVTSQSAHRMTSCSVPNGTYTNVVTRTNTCIIEMCPAARVPRLETESRCASWNEGGTQRGEASRQKFVRWGTNAGKSNKEMVPKASGAGLEMQRKGAVLTGPAPCTSPSKGITCRTAGKRV